MWIQDFVQMLEQARVDNSFAAGALGLKQRNLPHRIFKYRVDCDHSRANLMNNSVWICSPEAYNDPYDCSTKISSERLASAIQRGQVRKFVELYNLRNLISEEQIADAENGPEPLADIVKHLPASYDNPDRGNPVKLAEFFSKTALPKYAEETRVFIEQVQKAVKLCSFSEINDSILMWSHYADHHRGFCLEYDLVNLDKDHPLRQNLYPVVYSANIYDLTPFLEILVTVGRQKMNTTFPLLGVLHKFIGWEYEREWRLVFLQDAIMPDRAWQAPTAARVYLGSKMSDLNKKTLKTICEQKGIEVRQMQLDPDSFTLVSNMIH